MLTLAELLGAVRPDLPGTSRIVRRDPEATRGDMDDTNRRETIERAYRRELYRRSQAAK